MAKKRKKKAVKKRKKTAKRKKPAKKKTVKRKKTAPKKKTKKGKTKRGRRYTAKQRARLLKKYHELRKGGMSADKAAKKVGVSYLTLLKWEKKSGKKFKAKRGRPPGKKAALKKALKVPKGKKKKPAKPAGGLTLVTPSGFRIEGITSADLIKVLRGLK